MVSGKSVIFVPEKETNMEPKFKIGDHVSTYSSYWGRRTGTVVESLGLMTNIDGPKTENFVHRVKDDITGTVSTFSEKKMKTCRIPMTGIDR